MTATAADDGTGATIRVVASERLTGEILAGALADLVGAHATVDVVDQPMTELVDPHLVDHHEVDLVIELADADIAIVLHGGAPNGNSHATPSPSSPPRVTSLDDLASLICQGTTVAGLVATRPDARPAFAGAVRFTDRELEVLQEMRRGLDNAAIATTLGISVHTVRSHVGNILRKLGTSSRVEVIARLG